MTQSSEISGSGNSHNLRLPEVRKSYTYPISSSLAVSILYSSESVKGNRATQAIGVNKTGSSYFSHSEEMINAILVILCCRP